MSDVVKYKPEKAWAIYAPDGHVRLSSVSYAENDAIDDWLRLTVMLEPTKKAWMKLKRKGYSCQPVSVTVIEQAKNRKMKPNV